MKEQIKNLIKIILRKLRLDLSYFYNDIYMIERSNRKFYSKMSYAIDKLFKPRSIIDFGCARGEMLKYFENRDRIVLGLDGSIFAKKNIVIKEENFILTDLRDIQSFYQHFEIALCLEVAEHIEEKFSDNLICSLCDASDTIIFSAAIPGQGGIEHINLKHKSHWLEKFKEYHFELDYEKTRDLLIELTKINTLPWFYLHNTMILSKRKDL